ncbi:hypothetical protein ILUMI_21418 [Ignelater luminosus]|uniref:Uncharacterized protein n=1 Tax=Ignelater luminosus TaxID=2038154 RepID=A0A8K0G3W0_IGNLU|nr:hypothetical protein ILUMI_21418 [Ignelater luminosus]
MRLWLQQRPTHFFQKVEEVANNEGTARLWVQYFKTVTIVKKFVRAERTGDWQLHLQCHLCLQDTTALKTKLTQQEYHGRGLADSTLSRWIASMPTTVDIQAQVEQYCGVTFATTGQHVDARAARMQRDDTDAKKLKNRVLPVFHKMSDALKYPINLEKAEFVVDGGFLLHRVIWKAKEPISSIIIKYVDYIKNWYGKKATIVCEEYPDVASEKSTKSAESPKK